MSSCFLLRRLARPPFSASTRPVPLPSGGHQEAARHWRGAVQEDRPAMARGVHDGQEGVGSQGLLCHWRKERSGQGALCQSQVAVRSLSPALTGRGWHLLSWWFTEHARLAQDELAGATVQLLTTALLLDATDPAGHGKYDAADRRLAEVRVSDPSE